ncbi:hypothetical protein CLOM621_08405 [Clostridium sp. M62/1]|nr:hypothetical protein CLOM621_08405 [Clostridium sp. M62/1]
MQKCPKLLIWAQKTPEKLLSAFPDPISVPTSAVSDNSFYIKQVLLRSYKSFL